MKETISTRVTRLVSGSLHALLDAMEQAAPEAAMAQAIREVEQVIDEVRAELGRVLASRHVADPTWPGWPSGTPRWPPKSPWPWKRARTICRELE